MKLNAKQIQLLAAGAPQAEIDAAADTVETPAAAPAAAPAPAATPAAAVTPAADGIGGAAPAAAAPAGEAAPAAAAAAPAANELVAHLTGELTTVRKELVEAKVEAASFKASAEALPGLLDIARQALGHKLVALGGSAETAMTFGATDIVAEYKRVGELFNTKFKVGGVAQPAGAGKDTPQAATLDPVTAAAFEQSKSTFQ